jgi:hypothetical protein
VIGVSMVMKMRMRRRMDAMKMKRVTTSVWMKIVILMNQKVAMNAVIMRTRTYTW